MGINRTRNTSFNMLVSPRLSSEGGLGERGLSVSGTGDAQNDQAERYLKLLQCVPGNDTCADCRAKGWYLDLFLTSIS